MLRKLNHTDKNMIIGGRPAVICGFDRDEKWEYDAKNNGWIYRYVEEKNILGDTYPNRKAVPMDENEVIDAIAQCLERERNFDYETAHKKAKEVMISSERKVDLTNLFPRKMDLPCMIIMHR